MTQTDIKPFTKEDLEKADVQLLRDGRWGNARVSVANINGMTIFHQTNLYQMVLPKMVVGL